MPCGLGWSIECELVAAAHHDEGLVLAVGGLERINFHNFFLVIELILGDRKFVSSNVCMGGLEIKNNLNILEQ